VAEPGPSRHDAWFGGRLSCVSDPAAIAESLAIDGLAWLLSEGQPSHAGLAWSPVRGADVNPTLYQGGGGIVLALLEAHQHFKDESYADAAKSTGRSIAAAIPSVDHASLYFGLTGIAVTLCAIDALLDDAAARAAASEALAHVRSQFDGVRWNTDFELLAGNAGIALGALACGDVELALLAVTPYVHTAEVTDNGVQWEDRVGEPSRLHHISHGTLGIVAALAAVGEVAGHDELIELALHGAADVVSRNEADPAGFLVPHSDPQYEPELVPRYSYGWCHGPAGDAQVFRRLGQVTGDPAWAALVERCWSTVLDSGLPQRTRPGFWDNNGRCCGTAGVLALACDRFAEGQGDLAFAEVLVGDLDSRATRDDRGARWSNVEFREVPSDLAPATGWAQGNAGIVRELLRFTRCARGEDPSYAANVPDQPDCRVT
jgi:Lanthionine synthetase C-like protein